MKTKEFSWRWIFPWQGCGDHERCEIRGGGGRGVLHGRFGNRGPSGKMVGGGGCVGAKLC